MNKADKTAFVFFNGIMDSKSPYYKNLLKDKKYIYCADGGLKYALDIGVVPLEIWGDLDSIDNSLVEKAKSLGSKVIQFDPRKDFTDGELVLSELVKKDFDKIIVLGGLGGRIDHLLTNLNLLFKFDNIIFVDEKEIIFRADNNSEITWHKDKTISFIPMSDIVEEITLIGFEYPLNNYTVHRGETICTSNIIRSEKAVIKFKKGKLLAVIENKI